MMFRRQTRRRPGIGNNKYERHSRKLKFFTAITYVEMLRYTGTAECRFRFVPTVYPGQQALWASCSFSDFQRIGNKDSR